jgi:pyridoxine 5-phosphate synthase
MAVAAGADGITAHLREDRRHIIDEDIERLSAFCREVGRPLNFEMAATAEMEAIALRHRSHAACLVPERREERTTEGGLDVARGHNALAPRIRRLAESGARVSLFIEAAPVQVESAASTDAAVIELHVGPFTEAVRDGRGDDADRLLANLREAAAQAARLGLEVHAGHGIDYGSVGAISALPEVVELNIGHFLIGEAVFVGLDAAVRRMRALMDEARAA